MACSASEIMLRMELVMGQSSPQVLAFRDDFSHSTVLTLILANIKESTVAIRSCHLWIFIF